jgi:hypothetical protein
MPGPAPLSRAPDVHWEFARAELHATDTGLALQSVCTCGGPINIPIEVLDA